MTFNCHLLEITLNELRNLINKELNTTPEIVDYLIAKLINNLMYDYINNYSQQLEYWKEIIKLIKEQSTEVQVKVKLKELTGTHELEELADKDLIKEIQFNLNRLGYFLTADGVVGKRTLNAWARFKKDRYLDKPGEIGDSSIKLLLEAPSVKNGFHLPTNGVGWVSSPFGKRSMGFHKGIDIAANEGTPVFAIESGIVSNCVKGCSVGNWKCGGGYGNVVYLSHTLEQFDESRYAHLARLAMDISIGSTVRKGSLLGYVGNTGHSFGNHLHFELRKKGIAFNPQLVINPIV